MATTLPKSFSQGHHRRSQGHWSLVLFLVIVLWFPLFFTRDATFGTSPPAASTPIAHRSSFFAQCSSLTRQRRVDAYNCSMIVRLLFAQKKKNVSAAYYKEPLDTRSNSRPTICNSSRIAHRSSFVARCSLIVAR